MSHLHLDEQSLNALLNGNNVPAQVTLQPTGRLRLKLTNADGMHWIAKLFKAVHLDSIEISMTGGNRHIRFTIFGAIWALLPNALIRPRLPVWLTIVEHSHVNLDPYVIPSPIVQEILDYVELSRAAVPGDDGAAVSLYFHGKEK